MATDTRVAEKIECVAKELLEYAQALRLGEGDWHWQTATLNAQRAIRDQLGRDEGTLPPEAQTFQELKLTA